MKRNNRKTQFGIRIGLALLLAFILMPLSAMAQSFYGALVGTVSDGTGTVIADVTVTLTNLGTNEKREAKSDATGNYRFVNMLPANYRLEAEMTGFKRMTREPVTIQVGTSTRIDAALEVGSVTETVEVEARTPLLQTESATVGQVVEGTQVQETPLNGRNVLNLIALTPGVVPQTGSQGSLGTNSNGRTGISAWGSYQIGGGAAGQNAMYYDGAPATAFGGNIVTFVPTQDAVQEFKVETSGASSEYGRYGGGVINMTSKSGTNTLHGSAYEYFRNNVLNANEFFNKKNGKARGQWNQNQYGVTAGGPIIKDKLFGFFSWEGFTARTTNPATMNVPSDELNAGIFRKNTLPTSNAVVATLISQGCITNGLSDSTGAYWKVNSSCINAAANTMRKFYAKPTASGNVNNYFTNPGVGSDSSQYIGRVDYQLNSRQRLFGRYSYFKMDDLTQNLMNDANGYKTGNATSHFKMHQVALGDTYTVNTSSILDVRFSYSRAYYDQVPVKMDVDMSQFDSTGSTAWATLGKNMTYQLYPMPNFTGFYTLRGLGATTNVAINTNNSYTLAASMTKIAGAHTLKFGGSLWLMDNNGVNQFNTASGAFYFKNTMYTGDEYANFLLGLPTNATLATVSPTTSYSYYQGYYVNDTWQVGKKLSLDLGVRWELPGGMNEKNNKASVLLPDVVDPTNSARMGTLALVNSSMRSSRSALDNKYNLFAAHAGGSYRFGANTVVRAGYGISYLPVDMLGGSLATGSTINKYDNTFTNSTVATTPLSSVRTLANPYPSSIVQPYGTKFTMAVVPNSSTLSSPVPNFSYPIVQQWNVGMGQQFGHDVMVDLSYVGAKGTHMPITTFNVNQMPSSLNGTLASMIASGSTAATVLAYGQSKKPAPLHDKLLNTAAFRGGSNYQSLQAKIEKRFKSAGVIMANYTWAKSMSDADGVLQDYSNLHGDKSLATYDMPHRVVLNYVLKLPFGKGQKYGVALKGVAGKLVSGWAVNGISTWQTGTPLAISWSAGNILTTNLGGGTLRPDLKSGCTPALTGGSAAEVVIGSKAWMTNCFVAPGTSVTGGVGYSFGNQSRTDGRIRAQGMANFDFAVLKSTTFRERYDAQFRMEFFNIFNRTQFAAPNVYADSSSYGIISQTANRPRLIQASLRFNF